jgi:O-acetyl-ADP-ribose deacetylase (regulator of RNase III)
MHGERISVILGDITDMEVDVIVNAANCSLLGGGGVDGAIHREGGPAILAECREIRARQGGCKTGEAVITTAGNLPARWVIHTVGPVWTGGRTREEALLASAYRQSLGLAAEHGARTVAFPSISTGVYRFPKELAAQIAVREVTSFLADHPELEHVTFVCFDRETYGLYEALFAE